MNFKPMLTKKLINTAVVFSITSSVMLSNQLNAANVITTDQSVQGSQCVGFDCTSSESYGFDTLRLKENNLRIKFDDTSSSSGSFPNNDWQLTANDSGNGGANKFSIDDVTNGKTPFTVEANAPSHALYVASEGRIGIGTSTPVVNAHIAGGNTPTLRLEQNGSSGFTPQTWDIAGNETNFFIRDVTNSSELPFRIQPGSPDDTLTLRSSGNVGIGTWAPSSKLHVKGPDAEVQVSGSDGNTKLVIEETAGVAGQSLLELKNNAAVRVYLRNTGVTQELWAVRHNGNFEINTDDDSTVEFSLKSTGDLTINGTLTELSDVNSKENFEFVDGQQVLNKLESMPITSWSYKDNDPKVRHLGPMAQDFHSMFGLGSDDKGIATLDVGGVALAGIKQLNKNLQEKNQLLEERINELEKVVMKIALNSN